jgi:hypothetical protein
MSELADSAIDHVGKLLDNTGVRDYVWLACWLMGTYSIYLMLLKVNKPAYDIATLKKVLPFNTWLFGMLPEPFKTIGLTETQQILEALKGIFPKLKIAMEGT